MKPHILHETRRIIKCGYLVSTVFYQSSIKIRTHIKNTKATFSFRWRLDSEHIYQPLSFPNPHYMTGDGCLNSLEGINSQEQKELKLWKNQLWKLKSIWWAVITGQANPTPRSNRAPCNRAALQRWGHKQLGKGLWGSKTLIFVGQKVTGWAYQQESLEKRDHERTLTNHPHPSFLCHQNPKAKTERTATFKAENQKRLLFSWGNQTQRKIEHKIVTAGVLQQNSQQVITHGQHFHSRV